ncbi:ATP-binding protein [Oerskovia paurometabola]|uniref:ATP-binding protein n=1 Tax=Oerskovia paurometabola TaxID=162170 RepID=UPI0038028472
MSKDDGDPGDRRTLVGLAAANLLLFALASVVQLVPWGVLDGSLAGADGMPILTSDDPGDVLFVVCVSLLSTLVPAALVIAVLLVVPVGRWSRRRRVVGLAVLGLLAGVLRYLLVSAWLPGTTSWTFALAEIVWGAVGATGAILLAAFYIDTRRRIRAEERERAAEALRARAARADLEHEELRVRRDVSQQLHGGLQQQLVLAIADLEAVGSDLASRGDQAAKTAVQQVVDTLDRIREDEVRVLAHALFPVAADIDLYAAIVLLLDRLPASVHAELTFGAGGQQVLIGADLDTTDRVAVYTIVEEAITNAVRHGHATRIEVHLDVATTPDGARAVMTVDDDGTGLPDPAPALVGLLAPRARARRRGGDLTLHPSPLGGVRLAADLRLDGVAHQETRS